MISDLFSKFGKSKWLPWVVLSPFIIAPALVVLNGEVRRGIGMFALFASMWGGIYLGGYAARWIHAYILPNSESFGNRLFAGLAGFGFLFFVPIVGHLTNAFLHTDIELYPLVAHFQLACIGGGLFFCFGSSNSKD